MITERKSYPYKPRTLYKKPPLGLTPRYIVEEHRMQDIHEAVMRYKEAHKEVPIEWIEEYEELASRRSYGEEAQQRAEC